MPAVHDTPRNFMICLNWPNHEMAALHDMPRNFMICLNVTRQIGKRNLKESLENDIRKVWHKGCFKCQECGMTLNMRTYKGYGKLPYCEAHVPKAKHTTMAETPELRRIAENTRLQSNINYHADFEKSKGKFTQVADDPETLRMKANTKIISNVAYHGELEKKAQMEKQRQINENGELVGESAMETVQPGMVNGYVENFVLFHVGTP
ncbi:hypothetical protein MSG28_015143 [Choristoneura fumiferana]|uniref:Uncharacterized protein n=1 Tax=Choristoneura fumiferana TaxID=7141 RepID=A0ACC0KZB5_CHOFU|nr:hypothetical protein MSG28_015143 [Choristoneura fumiferana]